MPVVNLRLNFGYAESARPWYFEIQTCIDGSNVGIDDIVDCLTKIRRAVSSYYETEDPAKSRRWWQECFLLDISNLHIDRLSDLDRALEDAGFTFINNRAYSVSVAVVNLYQAFTGDGGVYIYFEDGSEHYVHLPEDENDA